MPIYDYKGLDQTGKTVKGVKEADSVKTLRALLRREGVLATEIEEAGSLRSHGKKPTGSVFSKQIKFEQLFQSVSAEALALMTRQLATLLQAGVPMVDSLAALIEQVESPYLKNVLSSVKADVNEGASLADALAKHKCFDNIYINLVRAGETSGAIEIVLERLSEFLEGQAQLKSKVMSAMMYPMVMMLVAFAVMIVMLTVVLPKITKIFETARVELPIMTRILIGISEFARNFWWLNVLLMGVAVYSFIRYIKTPHGRAKWDRFRLKAPVFGPIVLMIAVARFARTLATLLSSGVPLLTSLQIVRNVVANDALEKAIDTVRDGVREGQDIATLLRRTGEFPPMVTHMIAVGERSGEIETMLGRIASAYEQRVSVRVGMLMGLLEPLMIVFMGGTVFFIVISILVPILRMSQLAR